MKPRDQDTIPTGIEFHRRELARIQALAKRTQRVERKMASVPILTGTGSPLGVVTAPIGALYMRKDGGAGTTLYVKEAGTDATGWVAK